MDTTIKNALGATGAIALLAIGIASVMSATTYGRSIQPSSYRSFTVSGEGKATGIPDVAQFSFSVVTEGGKDIGALQQENTKKANAAIAFLKENGVEAKDITTSYYDVSPRYQNYACGTSIGYATGSMISAPSIEPCPPADIVGYTVSQSVSVKSRDFTKTGALLSGVVEKGANTVSSLSFVIDEPDTIESEARTEAIAKARTKAEAVAKAGGFSVGRILSITEGYVSPSYERAYATMDMVSSGKGAPVSPTIEPGSQDVVIDVSISFE